MGQMPKGGTVLARAMELESWSQRQFWGIRNRSHHKCTISDGPLSQIKIIIKYFSALIIKSLL